MVAGHLQEKKGYFYIVLSYPDVSGKRKTKWIPTSLPVKGNKKKAEKLLMEARREFEPECSAGYHENKVQLADTAAGSRFPGKVAGGAR